MTEPADGASDFRKRLSESVRILQIIVGALAGSCVVIAVTAVMALSLRNGGRVGEGPQGLAYVALAGVVVALIAATLVSNAITASARRRIAAGDRPRTRPDRRVPWQHAEFLSRFGDQAQLSGIYFTKTIVAAVILEGAAYLGLGAFYVTRNPLALAATAAAVSGILFLFPTVFRCQNWIDQQQRLLEADRQMEGHFRPTL